MHCNFIVVMQHTVNIKYEGSNNIIPKHLDTKEKNGTTRDSNPHILQSGQAPYHLDC